MSDDETVHARLAIGGLLLGSVWFVVAVAACIIFSACSPPSRIAATPTPPPLPPWTIVCDANGRYNYTWQDGQVNQFQEPANSAEEAARQMYFAKRSIEHPRERPKLPSYSIDGYQVCPK